MQVRLRMGLASCFFFSGDAHPSSTSHSFWVAPRQIKPQRASGHHKEFKTFVVLAGYRASPRLPSKALCCCNTWLLHLVPSYRDWISMKHSSRSGQCDDSRPQLICVPQSDKDGLFVYAACCTVEAKCHERVWRISWHVQSHW